MSQLRAQSGDGDDNRPLCLQLRHHHSNTCAGQLFHTWEMLEEYLVEHLPGVSRLNTWLSAHFA